VDTAKADRITIRIAEADQGIRLDKLLALKLPDLSRTYLAHLIESGNITLKNHINPLTSKMKLRSGELIEVVIPAPEPAALRPEPIPLEVIFEDSSILVINKSPSIVVHPGAGNESGTLVNAILHHVPDLSGINGTLRPGIVHRLDKDTSGVMVVAKNTISQQKITQQFQDGLVHKNYVTLVKGALNDNSGRLNLPVGRHPVDRKKMAVTSKGKQAVTEWEIIERFHCASFVSVAIHTGRTHQIRVHMSHIGHPVLGDTTYGGVSRLSTKAGTVCFSRQMLHARRLSMLHPENGERLIFEAEIPMDMTEALRQLRIIKGQL